MTSSISSKTYGVLPSGESVEYWTLVGSGGLQLEVITYGATITRLLVPDRWGGLDDVVLGFNNLDPYLANRACFGAIVGRVAGRITGARFSLEGETFQLAMNDGPNHLHGGLKGFDKRNWSARPGENAAGAPSLQLTYHSSDGEEGYPGNLKVIITYTVTDNNAILIGTEATTDKATPVSLTQHSYFNLGGEHSGSVVDHELEIHADEFVPSDQYSTLLGRVESVSGRDNDFRHLRNLGDAIPHLFMRHGDLYLTRKSVASDAGRNPVPVARLVNRKSGRVLEVSTTETHLQLYTGSGLDGSNIGKSGVSYGQYAGVCLECEGYPDGPNAPGLGDIILHPGRIKRETTVYAFSTISG